MIFCAKVQPMSYVMLDISMKEGTWWFFRIFKDVFFSRTRLWWCSCNDWSIRWCPEIDFRSISTSNIYIHCSNHSLDLVLKNSCDESNVKSFFGTIKSIIKFINKSPKRKMMFKAAVEATVSNQNHQHHHTLIKMCETR